MSCSIPDDCHDSAESLEEKWMRSRSTSPKELTKRFLSDSAFHSHNLVLLKTPLLVFVIYDKCINLLD